MCVSHFQVKDGKRIGYKIGTADTVNFDTLAKTDQQLGLLIQSVHKSGEATGEHAAAIEHLKANMSVAVFDAKLGSAVGPLDTRVTSVEDKLKTVGPLDARVKSVEDRLKTMATAATAAAQKKETCTYDQRTTAAVILRWWAGLTCCVQTCAGAR